MNEFYYKALAVLTDYIKTWCDVGTDEAMERAIDDLRQMTPTGNENISRMREVLKFAEQESALKDSRFDMGEWCTGSIVYGSQPECGTTMCLAGTAAWMDLEPGERIIGPFVYRGPTETGKVSDRGLESLGLSQGQKTLFFMTEAGPETIRPIMEYMAGETL